MNPENPSITVVTTVLNGRGRLERTIQSMAEQRCRAFEYIAVDGGSTDGTLEVLKANHAIMTSWSSEPDWGIADAFNKGIRLATSNVVGLLSAGDWYEPDTLAIIAKACKSQPDVDVFCGSIQFWESGSPSILCHSDPSRLEMETSVYHPTVFVKKSAYLKYGLYDENYRFAMDYELLLRFKRAGAKFFTIEKTLANMPLDGVSYKNWYAGLLEVRRARSLYFSPSNVTYHHLRAVAMNLVARFLKQIGMDAFYKSYRQLRNSRGNSGREA